MDAAMNRKSLMFGVPGIVLQIVGQVIMVGGGERAESPSVVMFVAGFLIILGGTALLMWGLAWYAAAKGHHMAWGLMGFLSFIGLIVLACLPDRKK